MSRPGVIELDDLVLDAGDLRRMLRLLVGSVVVRPDGLTFTIQRDGRELRLLAIDLDDLMPSSTLH